MAVVLLCAAYGDDGGQTRYSVSVTEEATAAAGLRVPGPDTGNLLLVQPSFSYKQSSRWMFSSSLAGVVNTQGETHSELRVRETFFSVSSGVFDVTAGKRLLRWGTGYAFTATGILDPPRTATDPTDRLSLNEGRELVKADWIHGGQDISVVWASAGLVQQHAGAHDTTAVRYNRLIAGFDTSVIVAHDTGGATFSGANFTRVFGEALELYGEFAWREGAAVLAGGKYSTRSGISMIAEFYSPPDTGYYRPASVPQSHGRQHYGFVRAGKSRLRELPGWKEWDVSASMVTNFDDRSRVAVLDISRRFGNRFSTYLHAQAQAGSRSYSQYGMIPYSALVSLGIRCQL